VLGGRPDDFGIGGDLGDELVGTLSLCFQDTLRDLRPLLPLLTRAGAVLAAAERESRKDRFLSLAAHELKTPLTSIKGFSYSLARRLEKGEPTDPRHVQVLERQAERQMRLRFAAPARIVLVIRPV